MTGYQAAYIALLVSAAVFSIIAIYASKEIRSPHDFFHNPSVPSNTVSLLVANITLGTGVVYLISGAQTHGALMLLVPLSTGVGYLLLARTLKTGTGGPIGLNFLAAIQEHIDRRHPQDPIPIAKAITICIAFVFTLALGYELIAAPTIMAPFVAAQVGPNASTLISAYLFAIATITVLFGGVKGVFRTDWIQLIAILAVTAMLIWSIAAPNTPSDSATTLATAGSAGAVTTTLPALQFNWQTLVAVSMACITAMATQFYSLLNWTIASHVQSSQQARVFRVVGLLTAALLLVIVLVGLVGRTTGKSVVEMVSIGYGQIAATHSMVSWGICAIVTFGLTSIVCSTVDSIMMAVTQFTYDNVLRGDSRNSNPNRQSLRRIRVSVLIGFAVVFIAMLAMSQRRRDLFAVLMTVAAGIPVFAPASWVFVRMLREPFRIAAIRRTTLWTYVGLFLLAYAVAAPLLFVAPFYVPYVGLSAFVVSFAYSVVLWRLSNRSGIASATTEAPGV